MMINNASHIAGSEHLQAPLNDQYSQINRHIDNQNVPMTKSNQFSNIASKKSHRQDLLNHQQVAESPPLPKNEGSSKFLQYAASRSKSKIRMYGSKKSIPAYTILLSGIQNQSRFLAIKNKATTNTQGVKDTNYCKSINEPNIASSAEKQNYADNFKHQSSDWKAKKKVIGARRVVSPTFTLVQPSTSLDNVNRYPRQPSHTYVPQFSNHNETNGTKITQGDQKRDQPKSRPKLIGRQRKVTAQIDEVRSPNKAAKEKKEQSKRRQKTEIDEDSQNIDIGKAQQTQRMFLLPDYDKQTALKQKRSEPLENLAPQSLYKNIRESNKVIIGSNKVLAPKIDIIDQSEQNKNVVRKTKQSNTNFTTSIKTIPPKIDIIQQNENKLSQSKNLIKKPNQIIQKMHPKQISNNKESKQIRETSKQREKNQQKKIVYSSKVIGAKIDVIQNQNIKPENKKEQKKIQINQQKPKQKQFLGNQQQLKDFQQQIIANNLQTNQRNNLRKKGDTYFKNKKMIGSKQSLNAYVINLKEEQALNQNIQNQNTNNNVLSNQKGNQNEQKALQVINQVLSNKDQTNPPIKSQKKQSVIIKSQKKLSAKIDLIPDINKIQSGYQNSKKQEIDFHEEKQRKGPEKKLTQKNSLKKISPHFDEIKQSVVTQKLQQNDHQNQTFIKQQNQVLQQKYIQKEKCMSNQAEKNGQKIQNKESHANKKQTIILSSNKSIKSQINYINPPVDQQKKNGNLQEKKQQLKSLKSQIDFILESQGSKGSNKSLKQSKKAIQQKEKQKQNDAKGSKKSIKLIPSNKSIAAHFLSIQPKQSDQIVMDKNDQKQQIKGYLHVVNNQNKLSMPQQKKQQSNNNKQLEKSLIVAQNIQQKENLKKEKSKCEQNQNKPAEKNQQQQQYTRKTQKSSVSVENQNDIQNQDENINNNQEKQTQKQKQKQCQFILQQLKKNDYQDDLKCSLKNQNQQQIPHKFILNQNSSQIRAEQEDRDGQKQEDKINAQDKCYQQKEKQQVNNQDSFAENKSDVNQNKIKQSSNITERLGDHSINPVEKDLQKKHSISNDSCELKKAQEDQIKQQDKITNNGSKESRETHIQVDRQNKQNQEKKQSSSLNQMKQLPENTTSCKFILEQPSSNQNQQFSLNLPEASIQCKKEQTNQKSENVQKIQNKPNQLNHKISLPVSEQESVLFKDDNQINEKENLNFEIQQPQTPVVKSRKKIQSNKSSKQNLQKSEVPPKQIKKVVKKEGQQKKLGEIEQKTQVQKTKMDQKFKKSSQKQQTQKKQKIIVKISQPSIDGSDRKQKYSTQYLNTLESANHKDKVNNSQSKNKEHRSSKEFVRRGSQVDLVPLKLEAKNSDGYSGPDKIKSKPSTETAKPRKNSNQQNGLSQRSELSGDQKGSLKALVRISPRQYNKQQEQFQEEKKQNNISASKKSLDCEVIQLKSNQSKGKRLSQNGINAGMNAKRSSSKKLSNANACQVQSSQQPSMIKKIGYCKFKQGQQKKQFNKGVGNNQANQNQIKSNNINFNLRNNKNENGSKYVQDEQQKSNKRTMKSNNSNHQNYQSESKNKKPKVTSPYLVPVFNNFNFNSTKSKNSTFYNGSDLDQSYQEGNGTKANRHKTLQVNGGQQSLSKGKHLKKGVSGSKSKNNLPFNQRQMQKLRAQYEKLKNFQKRQIQKSQRSTRKSKRVRVYKSNEKSSKNIQNDTQNQKQQRPKNFLKAHSHQFSYLYPTVELDQTKGKLNKRLKQLDKKLNRASYSIAKRRQQGEVHEYIAQARREIEQSSKYLAQIDNV